MQSFKEYLALLEVKECGAFFLPESLGWAKSLAALMPKIDLNLPSVTKMSRILSISRNSNPIVIELADGSKIVCSYDQFRRLGKSVEPGRTANFTMLRGKEEKPAVITSFKLIS